MLIHSFIYFISARQHVLSALYAIVRPSVCLSVRLSVRRVDHRKTVEVRIMKFSPYGSPIVFVGYVLSRNSKGFPRAEASKKGGAGKISSFLALSVNILKTVAHTATVTIND